MISCIIIDDEPNAIEILKTYLQNISSVKLVECFRNPVKALNYLLVKQVDLIFLDINMPGMSGIDIIRSLHYKPAVIFTTAYMEYGAQSYDYNAVDYLVKPIIQERFIKAINKAMALLIPVTKGEATIIESDHVFLKSGTEHIKVQLADIIMVEKKENYLCYVTPDAKILVRGNMQDVQGFLPSSKFLRVHKSYIVGLLHITKIDSNSIFIGSYHIPISDPYKSQIQKILQPKK